MKSITDLQGQGKNKKCLIIGSGMSVLDLDFSRIPEDVVRIGLNFLFLPIRIDYNVFTDSNYVDFLNGTSFNMDMRLIGLESNIRDGLKQRCDFSFMFGEVPAKSHSGFYALYIADQIMEFDEIYLIGYDYCMKDGRVHYYGDHYMDSAKKELYVNKYFNMFMGDFVGTQWKAKIYNLNRWSRLKMFRFKEKI